MYGPVPPLILQYRIRNLPSKCIHTRAQMPTDLRREYTRIHNAHIPRPIHPPLRIYHTTQLPCHHPTRSHRMRIPIETPFDPLAPRFICIRSVLQHNSKTRRDLISDVFRERRCSEEFPYADGDGGLDECVDGELEEVWIDARLRQRIRTINMYRAFGEGE